MVGSPGQGLEPAPREPAQPVLAGVALAKHARLRSVRRSVAEEMCTAPGAAAQDREESAALRQVPGAQPSIAMRDQEQPELAAACMPDSRRLAASQGGAHRAMRDRMRELAAAVSAALEEQQGHCIAAHTALAAARFADIAAGTADTERASADFAAVQDTAAQIAGNIVAAPAEREAWMAAPDTPDSGSAQHGRLAEGTGRQASAAVTETLVALAAMPGLPSSDAELQPAAERHQEQRPGSQLELGEPTRRDISS